MRGLRLIKPYEPLSKKKLSFHQRKKWTKKIRTIKAKGIISGLITRLFLFKSCLRLFFYLRQTSHLSFKLGRVVNKLVVRVSYPRLTHLKTIKNFLKNKQTFDPPPHPQSQSLKNRGQFKIRSVIKE